MRADVILAISTSGMVYPAAGLATPKNDETIVAKINPEPGFVGGRDSMRIAKRKATMLPELTAHVRRAKQK